MSQLYDLVKKTRSVRSFIREKEVKPEDLRDIISYCRLCPSSANLQALKFRAVFRPEEAGKVFAATKWAGYIKDEKIPPEGHECPAFIVICVDKDIAKNPVPFYKDTGICAEVIMLRATEKGLGGCMIGSFDAEEIKRVLGLGDNLELTLVIALGYPDEEPEIVDCDGDIKYYRRNGRHYVPKRSLEDIII